MPPPEYSPRRERESEYLRYVVQYGYGAQRDAALNDLVMLDYLEPWADPPDRARKITNVARLRHAQRTCLALGEVEYGD